MSDSVKGVENNSQQMADATSIAEDVPGKSTPKTNVDWQESIACEIYDAISLINELGSETTPPSSDG